jgi:hypothetical protein
MKPTFPGPSRSSSSGISYHISDDDDDDDDRDDPRNVGFIQTPDAADSPTRLSKSYNVLKFSGYKISINHQTFIPVIRFIKPVLLKCRVY